MDKSYTHFLPDRTIKEFIQALKVAYCKLPNESKTFFVPDDAEYLCEDEIITILYRKNTLNLWFNYNWPEDYGFRDDAVVVELQPGVMLDRLGDPFGNTFCKKESPPSGYEDRSLPYYIEEQYGDDITQHPAFKVYETAPCVSDFPIYVKVGKVAPSFNKGGGATQIMRCTKEGAIMQDAASGLFANNFIDIVTRSDVL